MTRVLIVDDQQLVRTGLMLIIDAEPDLCVVGEAPDGASAIAQAKQLSPDVILMDVQMPGMSGIDATRQILAGPEPTPRVIVLTTFSQAEVVYEALTAGACGFLLKDMPGVQLVGGIRAVARGEELLAPALTRRLIEQFVAQGRRSSPPGLSRLTERELDVLKLVATGRSNAEIAEQLFVSPETVKTHVSRMLVKLGLRDRVQAVILSYEAGIVRAGTPPDKRTAPAD
jgi:DNA-binding NarL/FixJ family response regulator